MRQNIAPADTDNRDVVTSIFLAVARKIFRPRLAVLRARKTSLRPAHIQKKPSSRIIRLLLIVVTDNFLLKISATPPRAVALRPAQVQKIAKPFAIF